MVTISLRGKSHFATGAQAYLLLLLRPEAEQDLLLENVHVERIAHLKRAGYSGD